MPANVLLLRWAGGWAERTRVASITAYARSEALLGTGALGSLAEVYRVADEQLDEFADPREETIAGVAPAADSEEPYIAYRIGDTVTVPDETLAAQSRRMVSITVGEDADGNAQLVPSFGQVIIDEDSRLVQAGKKMINGTLGGRSKVAQPVLPTFQPRALIGGAVAATCADGTWTSLTASPLGSAHSAVVLDGYVYVLQNNTVASKPFARYNIAAGAWATLTSLVQPTAESYFQQLFAWGGYVYALGVNANAAAPRATTMRYDPAADTWTAAGVLAEMPTPRRGQFAMVSGKIYCPGGIVTATDTLPYTFGSNVHEVYDIATDSWASLAALTERFFDGTVCASGGFVYVFSRWDVVDPPAFPYQFEEFGPQRYHPPSDTWIDLRDHPQLGTGIIEEGVTAALANGLIIISTGSNDWYLYDTQRDSWESIADPPGFAVHYTGIAHAGEVGNTGYFPAGGTSAFVKFTC